MVKKLFRKRKEDNQLLAEERIGMLMALADKEALEGDLALASGHVKRARALALKFNVRMPKEYKMRFCRNCYAYLLPGKSSRVRMNSREKRVEVLCLECGKKAFFPYRREVKARRKALSPKSK